MAHSPKLPTVPEELSEPESDNSSSRGSSPAESEEDWAKNADNDAHDTMMVYSTGGIATLVHVFDVDRSTEYFKYSKCGRQLKAASAHLCTAWESTREDGRRSPCLKCQKFWPEGLASLLQ